MTLQQAIEKFVKDRSIRSRASANTYCTSLNRLILWLDGQIADADDLTSQHLKDFAVWLVNDYRTENGKQLAPASVDLYLTAVLQFYEDLVLDGHDAHNFVATKEWIKRRTGQRDRPPIEKKLPPPEAVTMLLEAADKPPEIPEDAKPGIRERTRLIWLRDRAVVYCLHSSGARVGEIAGLKWGDLIAEDQGAWVVGKGNRERFIRFSPAAWERLNAYLDARGDELRRPTPLFIRHDRAASGRILGLTTLTIERAVNRLASEAGVLDIFHLTPHSFRHNFATCYLRHTKNLALTQDVLGHKNPATTRIYAKTSKEDLIAAHKEIFDEV